MKMKLERRRWGEREGSGKSEKYEDRQKEETNKEQIR
jgi:hypothetical protein